MYNIKTNTNKNDLGQVGGINGLQSVIVLSIPESPRINKARQMGTVTL